MYQQYWGFKQPPFNVGKDGQGYFKSPSQVEALARLTFLVENQHRLGLLVEQLRDLADFDASSAFTELEKLVLRYTVALTHTPTEVSDELFDNLRQHLNPQQIVELTSAIAWENYRSRYNRAFGIEAEGFSAGTFCPLPTIESHKEPVAQQTL